MKSAKSSGATTCIHGGSSCPAMSPPAQKVNSADNTSSTYRAGRSTWTKASPARTRRRRGSAVLSLTPRLLSRRGVRVQNDRDAIQPFVRLIVLSVGERRGHLAQDLLHLAPLRVAEPGRRPRALQAADLLLDESLVHLELRHRLGKLAEQVPGAREVALAAGRVDLRVQRLLLRRQVGD